MIVVGQLAEVYCSCGIIHMVSEGLPILMAHTHYGKGML